MDEFFDIAVVGGGMTGLAFALDAAASGNSVVVVDRIAADPPALVGAETRADPRVTAVAQGSVRYLEALGVWKAIAPFAQPIERIEVIEARSPFRVRYDHSVLGDDPLGYIVDNRSIRMSLIGKARATEGIELRMPASWAAVEPGAECVRLELADGRSIRCHLLVAADGKFSKLRDALGLKHRTSDYRQNGIVATLGHALPHDGLASEHFFADGPFAVLPMRGNRSSIVWAVDRALAAEITALPPSEFLDEIAERVGSRLGALELQSEVGSFPMVLKWSEKITGPRVALIGDAARGIHPIAGQGWNLALRDAAALAECVSEQAKLGLDPGQEQVLKDYAGWRRFDAAALVAITDGINRLFANDLTPLRLLRGAGFGLVERLPPLKRMFMRHATATMGDLPARMRPRSA